MTDLTKEGTPWKWDEEEESSFCELKRISVGAILEQYFGQGLQPVAYESRKLNPAETCYLAYERELLGIVWIIGKWRHYLARKHFIVQIDHSSLRHLPNQPSVNRRI